MKINLIERKLFFTTANAHFKVGCPVLALEVLSRFPEFTKKSGSSPLSKASPSQLKLHPASGERHPGSCGLGAPAAPGMGRDGLWEGWTGASQW
ncbi:hypothetical protein INR49_008323 [Caranx melampygus]|nr:hypothetical protein INR49_008323 [Caranx melampygus]